MADSSLTPQEQLVVLRKYALGDDLTAITKEMGCDHEDVVGVVSVVGYQRGRASELLRQREQALMGQRVNARPAPSPATPPGQVPRLARPESVDKVLSRARDVGGKFAQKAERIRTMTVDLANELAEMLEAERRVQELTDELARAKKRATELRKGAAVAAIRSPSGGPEGALVRMWAQENGLDCPKGGPIPKAVLDAYQAAKGKAAAA